MKISMFSALLLSQRHNPANGNYPESYALELREPGQEASTLIQVPVKLDDGLLFNQIDVEFQGVRLFSGTSKNGKGYAILKASSCNVLMPPKK